MFAVIMGMGIVHLMIAIAALLQNELNVKIYWVHAAWLFFLLLLHFHVWWGFWDFRLVNSWNYFTYLFMLLGPVALFLAVKILIPEASQQEKLDMREFYYRVHRQFYTTMALAVLWGIMIYPVFFGKPDPVLEWLLLFLAVMIALAFLKNPKLHAVLTVVAWALFLTWVLSYGFTMQESG
ncbi:MAG: hypothetical protein AMJ61_00010 [Desulfobacterales bacterium SG8_35_2]|nr:MAG: hypothetical protein AMJ61_00010 [Desulfobacterales bacterium SG8_35_2]